MLVQQYSWQVIISIEIFHFFIIPINSNLVLGTGSTHKPWRDLSIFISICVHIVELVEHLEYTRKIISLKSGDNKFRKYPILVLWPIYIHLLGNSIKEVGEDWSGERSDQLIADIPQIICTPKIPLKSYIVASVI